MLISSNILLSIHLSKFSQCISTTVLATVIIKLHTNIPLNFGIIPAVIPKRNNFVKGGIKMPVITDVILTTL